MSSSEKTPEATEEEKMDVTCPESTSESADMDDSSSAEGNKNKAGKETEVSNLRASPPQVNQAENTPLDNHIYVDNFEPETKRTKQNTESGNGTKGLRAEKLMKCPKCEAKIAPPSVTFYKETNDQYAFNIDLQQVSGDDCKDMLDWTNKAVDKTTTKQCPECEHSFPVKHSVVSRTNRMGGFDIEFSIDIKGDKLEDETVGGTQSQNRNCDDKGMEQDEGEDNSSTGSHTDDSSILMACKDWINKIPDKLSTLKKPEQSNQPTKSEGWFNFNRFKPPTPVVKVHYTPTTDTFGADAAIMKQLENNLKLEKTTRRNCSIIILFCPVTRSFESEIKSALKKEEVSSVEPFILVLMHHTRDPDYSTAGCDASEVLKNVFYVHVFYHDSAKGLLRCKQNDTAIRDIERKLQTYKQ